MTAWALSSPVLPATVASVNSSLIVDVATAVSDVDTRVNAPWVLRGGVQIARG
jgi:hypothetical protein